MSDEQVFDAGSFLDAASRAIGLTITPEQRPGVIRFLEVARAMAVSIDGVVDADVVEPAPVFFPGAPTSPA